VRFAEEEVIGLWGDAFAALNCFPGAGASGTGIGGLRGAATATTFAEVVAGEGGEDFAAVVAGLVKSCGGSALDATALRTGTAGPPGQPMAAVPTGAVADPSFPLTWRFAPVWASAVVSWACV